MTGANETLFEDAISSHLVDHGGYDVCKRGVGHTGPADLDPALGIDTAELFAFVGATQSVSWSALVKHHGGDPGAAQRKFVQRLAQQLDERGTLDVLRHGVMDGPVSIRLAYFKPAHGLTPELVQRASGEPLNPAHFEAHLRARYLQQGL